ncbi:MAG: peptidase M28, partial [Flavobacterium sp.]|nr:peptidase M28 [Flavobacterium sp.]
TTFFGWKLILIVYPQYNDILQGFTYNGHDYVFGFLMLSLSICFWIYNRFTNSKNVFSYLIAPIFIWIIINFGIALKLQGAGFIVFPLMSSLCVFGVYVLTQKNYWLLNLVFAIPALVIFAPLLELFPIGLGLKIMFGSSVLLVLIFGLLIPIFGSFSKKSSWGILFLLIAIISFAKAHFNSNYKLGQAKPNSLIYLYNADTNNAFWITYDKNLDEFTKKQLGENPKIAVGFDKFPLFSKYNSQFTFMNNADVKDLSKPEIQFLKDSLSGDFRFLKIKISPTRKVNRYDIFANQKIVFFNFKSNGVQNIEQKTKQLTRNGNKILTYYVVDNIPLELEFTINKKTVLDMDLLESSFDLLTNPAFEIEKRKSWMMPMPFVLNDAIVIKKHIRENINYDENLSEEFKNMKLQEKLLKLHKDSIQ